MGLLFWDTLPDIRLPSEVLKNHKDVFCPLFFSIGQDVFSWEWCNPDSKITHQQRTIYWLTLLKCPVPGGMAGSREGLKSLNKGAFLWVGFILRFQVMILPLGLAILPTTCVPGQEVSFTRLFWETLMAWIAPSISMNKGVGHADELNQVAGSPPKAGWTQEKSEVIVRWGKEC